MPDKKRQRGSKDIGSTSSTSSRERKQLATNIGSIASVFLPYQRQSDDCTGSRYIRLKILCKKYLKYRAPSGIQ